MSIICWPVMQEVCCSEFTRHFGYILAQPLYAYVTATSDEHSILPMHVMHYTYYATQSI